MSFDLTSIVSGGLDTSAIDPFRQGVEITHLKYYDAGIVKILAGDPGHQLVRNCFGEDVHFKLDDPRFTETETLNPVAFVASQDINLALDPLPFFPNTVVRVDTDITRDGVLEPFTIRDVITFASTELPFVSHDIHGVFSDGNADATFASDRILTVDYIDHVDHFPAFVDGYYNIEKAHQLPFVDARYPRNVAISTNYSSDMNTALSLMSGSTDNYVSFKQRSATCGWTYENSATGTDSIAFGGMTF